MDQSEFTEELLVLSTLKLLNSLNEKERTEEIKKMLKEEDPLCNG